MKINLVLLDEAVYAYLKPEKPTIEPPVACGNIEG